jgi:hypothetical protein
MTAPLEFGHFRKMVFEEKHSSKPFITFRKNSFVFLVPISRKMPHTKNKVPPSSVPEKRTSSPPEGSFEKQKEGNSLNHHGQGKDSVSMSVQKIADVSPFSLSLKLRSGAPTSTSTHGDVAPDLRVTAQDPRVAERNHDN